MGFPNWEPASVAKKSAAKETLRSTPVVPPSVKNKALGKWPTAARASLLIETLVP